MKCDVILNSFLLDICLDVAQLNILYQVSKIYDDLLVIIHFYINFFDTSNILGIQLTILLLKNQ